MSDTKWSIQYTDESGGHVMRETSDIGEVHATIEHIVNDAERTAGYAGQTATWHGYEARGENGEGRGNWSLDIVNLDTHRDDGYSHEEWAEIEAMVERDAENDGNWASGLEDEAAQEPAMSIAPKAERVAILADMLNGLTKLSTTKYNLWVEVGNQRATWQREGNDIIVRQTNGSTLTLDLWFITVAEDSATINIRWNGQSIDYAPMDALVWLHTEFQRH